MLHDPPLRLRDEAGVLVGGVAFDDLDVDAERGAVFDDGLLEALAPQGLLTRR
ncbi:hypothetical protein [Streptomyces sp. NPDC001604]|uniref:hypothetical protein n=1 Tax=Streptomyces sp. NPDC001604 TaxID=3364593 RepID=UPI0036A930EA